MNTRKPNFVIAGSFLVAAVGYFLITIFLSRPDPAPRIASSFNGSQTDSEIKVSDHQNETRVENTGDVANDLFTGDDPLGRIDSQDALVKLPDISPVQDAFSGQSSITEALKSIARNGRIDYDGLVKNLALWEPLCSANSSRLIESGLIEKTDETTPKDIEVAAFCRAFPSDFSRELSEFLSIDLEETFEGQNDWSRRLNSVENLGADLALESAIHDLQTALDWGDYAAIAEIVWFLGYSGLLEERAEKDKFIPGIFADPEVLIVVSSSLFCLRLGGCSGQHPVTMSLCLQFRERQCSNPGSIDHAVEQILTGYELDLFYRMRQSILALLSNTP